MESFIEFPVFDGVSGGLKQWILWLEEFFVRERFTAMEKMNLAQSLLEGEAESWFYSQKRSIFQSWEHLMDLLIWRFADFSDPELFLLWDKNDRLLQKKRDAAKLRRMSRTAITPPESIPLLATIHETVPGVKFSEQQVDEISGETKESKKELDLSLGKITSHLKSTLESQPDVPCHENANANLPNTTVHVSDSANLRNIETVVMKAKIQKNIGMDVVNGDVEKIQCVMSINVSAHQVLDKMCQLKGLETKKKMKVLKSWMFKYKPERRRSRKRHNRDWFNTLSRGESGRTHKHGGIAKLLNSIGDKLQSYGYVLDITFLRRLRVHQQQQKIKSTKTWRFKYKSRLKKINLTDTKFWGEKVHGVSCLSLAAQFNSLELIQGNDEVSTKIIDNAASSSGRHAKSLLIEMGFCPTLVQKAIDENGEDLELLLEILTKSTVTEDPSFHGPMEPKPEPDIESETDSRRMTLLTMKFPKNLVALALDRLGNDTPIDEMVYLIVAAQLAEKSAAEFEESLDGTATIEEDEDVVPVAARGPTVSNELLLQTMDKTLHLLEMGFSNHEISMTIDKIGTESQISDLAESIVTGEVRGHFPDDLEGIEKKVSKSWRFVGVDAQKEDGGGGSSRGTANITPDPGIDTFPFPATANLGANVHILPAAEQKSSSIWHRWRRKDCTRTSSCVLSLQFSFFKLEDKLIFGEGSIDTLHQVD